jgi:hypothetical protein
LDCEALLVFVCIVLRQTPTGVAAMDRGAVFRAGATRRESGVSGSGRDPDGAHGAGRYWRLRTDPSPPWYRPLSYQVAKGHVTYIQALPNSSCAGKVLTLEVIHCIGMIICDSQTVSIMPGPEPSDDELKLLRAVRMVPRPFATVKDIVPETSVGRRQTQNRLDDLVDEGLLNVETVGTTNVYWLSDEGLQRLDSST